MVVVVVVDVVGVVVVPVHRLCAWVRSAASCCWSASGRLVLGQRGLVLGDWRSESRAGRPAVRGGRRRRRARRRRRRRGVRSPSEDWLFSSSTSLASSALSVDWADETDSLSAVVSSVPSVCPAVTCWPDGRRDRGHLAGDLEGGGGVADRLDVADDGHGLPDVGPGDAWPCGSPAPPPLTAAQAATPPPSTTSSDEGTDEDGAPVAGTAPARA